MMLSKPFVVLGFITCTFLTACNGEDQNTGQTSAAQAGVVTTPQQSEMVEIDETIQGVVKASPEEVAADIAVNGDNISTEIPPTQADMAQSDILDPALDPGAQSDTSVPNNPPGNTNVTPVDTTSIIPAPEVRSDPPISTEKNVRPDIYPGENALDIMTNERIVASFSAQTDYSKVMFDAFTLSVNGSSIDGYVSSDNGKARFTPSQPLTYNTLYKATVKVRLQEQSTGEMISSTYSWSFTTIDPGADKIVFFKDFNDESIGVYTEDDLRKKWNVYRSVGVANGRVSILSGGESNPGNVMRVKYLRGKHGAGEGAAQWKAPIGAHDELYFSYWIRFNSTFDFMRGGKIPGLAGGQANSGGATPTGRDGWSARMMWRPRGQVVQYMYYPDQPNAKGQDFNWATAGQRYFKPGEWHRVETRIKMNTPGSRNGIVQSWFDGRLALDRRNVRFRNISSFSINWLMFSTFFGGADPTWAPPKNEYVYFDNLIVAKSRITAGPRP